MRPDTILHPKLVISSRCAWTLYNFRRSLAARLAALGVGVTLVGGGGDGFDLRLQAEGYGFRSVPVSREGANPAADLRLFMRFRALFREIRPQLFHAFTIKPAIYGTLAAWAAGVPVRVVTITGLGHAFTTGKPWLRAVVETLYRLALRRAHLVFFQNADDRDLFLKRRLVAPEKVRLIAGSGVDLDRFTPQPLPCAGGATPHFLMVARLLKEKGVREYVHAATTVRARLPDARFSLIGGVDPRNPSSLSAEEFHVLNGAGAVEWMGEVDDVAPHIAAADVIVLPSYREGVPRSLLEGAAMGRALVATDAVGCREVVVDGENGYLVPIQDAEALAAAMIKLLEAPDDAARMGAAARALVEQRFDEKIVIDQIIAAYEELLDSKGLGVRPAAAT